MRKNQTSLTAAGIAIARAVESEKPAGERICYDPYARQFVSAWMVRLMGLFIKSGYTELRGPGVNGFLIARERYIDDVLQNFLKEGLQQLVILGAGYDSRAYRFDLPAGLKTFEVDHPVTQAEKVKKVELALGRLPAHVTYIPIDFNLQNLSECLLPAGYNPDLVSLFIWQGVTMYLTADVIDDTLAFIVTNACHGSAVVFDYVYQALLDGTQTQSEIKNMQRYRFMTGEELKFGIPAGQVETFLLTRGFRQVTDICTEDLKAAYFTGKNADREIASGYGIVIGRV